MVTQAPRRAAVAVAIVFALSCVVLITYVWKQFGGALPLEARGYRVHAAFLQASQLTPNADVRIAGVNVGKVVAVQRRGLRSDATIQLEARYAPLASDARAILRQKTLLGETFVALTTGSAAAAKLPDGGRLPDLRIADTQQLDAVLGTFNVDAQHNLQSLLAGLSLALDGRGIDLNSAVGSADPTLQSLDGVVKIVDGQGDYFGRLIRNTGAVLETVAARSGDLRHIVRAGGEVFSATARRNRELTQTVDALPAFLTQLRATLVPLNHTAAVAAPSFHLLRHVAPLLAPAMRALIRVSPQLHRLLLDLAPLIDASAKGLPAVSAIIDASVPFLDRLLSTARQVTPQMDLVNLYGPNIGPTLANVAAAMQATTSTDDGTTIHYLRTLIPGGNESNVTATQRPGSNRHNPYPAPGALAGVGAGAIAAADCRNTSNSSPPPSNPPPCHLQAPLAFQGSSGYYPHVTPLP